MTSPTAHDWKVGGTLDGVQLQPREIAAGLYLVGFHDVKVLADAVKVCLSESQGYERAFNDNHTQIGTVAVGSKVRNGETGEPYLVKANDGNTVTVIDSRNVEEVLPKEADVVTSRDVGLMQINIPAALVGTSSEEALYVPATNFVRAFMLWSKRGFQPWVAYVEHVYLRDTYVKRANRGVGNWLAELDLAKTPTDTLAGAPYVHTLTTPVLDYEYRVTGMNAALVEAHLLCGKHPLPQVQLEHTIAAGLAAAKA